jgi:hypothetical protein
LILVARAEKLLLPMRRFHNGLTKKTKNQCWGGSRTAAPTESTARVGVAVELPPQTTGVVIDYLRLRHA